MVIADPQFCRETTRRAAIQKLSMKYADADFKIVFFDNNPNQCLENAKRRPNKKVDKLISFLSDIYDPPRIDMKVWRE